MQMCRASGAALCDAPASCSQPQELPGAVMEQSSVLYTLSQDGAGWPGSFSQCPERKSWEQSPHCQRLYPFV